MTDDPEGYKQAAILFYTTMGEHLNATASETTGDTALELERLGKITQWLDDKKNFLNTSNNLMLEAIVATGCLNRISKNSKLWEKLWRPRKSISYPSNQTRKFHSIQADLADPNITGRIGVDFDIRYMHMVCHQRYITSCPTTGVRTNLSRAVKIGGTIIIDVPIGYEKEVTEYFQAHPDSTYGNHDAHIHWTRWKAGHKTVFHKSHL